MERYYLSLANNKCFIIRYDGNLKKLGIRNPVDGGFRNDFGDDSKIKIYLRFFYFC